MKSVYGYETLEDNDPFVAMVQKMLANGEIATRPGYLVDLMPWSESRRLYVAPYVAECVLVRYIPSWFPLAGFQRIASKSRADYKEILLSPFDYAVDRAVRLCD